MKAHPRNRAWLLILALAASPALAAAPSPAPTPPRPRDAFYAAAGDTPIQWGADWDSTLTANTARWMAELKAVADPAARDREMAGRSIRLMEAMMQKWPDQKAKVLAGYQSLAAWYLALADRGRAVNCYRILAESSDKPAEVATWLHAILRDVPWNQPWYCADGREWTDYASRRLLALHQAGQLPDSHPAVVNALQARIYLAGPSEALLAASYLPELRRQTSNEAADAVEAELLTQMGRADLAMPLFARAGQPERLAYAATLMVDLPLDLPRQFEVERRMEALRSAAPEDQAKGLWSLLRLSLAEPGLMPIGDGRYVSNWHYLHNWLATLPPAAVQTAGGELADEAAKSLRAARRGASTPLTTGGGPEALLSLYRRYPATETGTQALGEYAAAMLQSGRYVSAQRSFREVLAQSHSSPGEQAKAQVGLWLALAGAGEAGALDAAMAAVKDDQPLPYQGQTLTAGQIKQRIRVTQPRATVPQTTAQPGVPTHVGMPQAAAQPPVAAAPQATPQPGAAVPQLIRPPAVQPWGGGFLESLWGGLTNLIAPLDWSVTSGEGRVYLCGPNALACYDPADLSKPLWVATPRLGIAEPEAAANHATCPRPVNACVADGRVYARWGLQAPVDMPQSLAAFDAKTGAMLWSIHNDPAWDGGLVVSDPVAADGRVFVLTLENGPIPPLALVCVDGATGKTIYRRTVFYARTMAPAPPSLGVAVNAAYYGNAVTIRDGSVYCSSNAGAVARCDIRDGQVEWLSPYTRTIIGTALEGIRRLGAAPVVMGDKVILLPRDYPGALAMDAQTGATLWESPYAASRMLAGVTPAGPITAGYRTVEAIYPATGMPRWRRDTDSDVLSAVVQGGNVCVATLDKLLTISAATGELLDQRPWDANGPPAVLATAAIPQPGVPIPMYIGIGMPQATTLLAVPRESENLRQPVRPLNAAAAQTFPPGPAVALSWTLPRRHPRLIAPPDPKSLPGAVLALSDNVLECIAATPAGRVNWQAVLPAVPVQTEFVNGMVLLVLPKHVIALDAATGQQRWITPILGPGPATWASLAPGGSAMLVRSAAGDLPEGLTMLDVAGGKVLWQRRLNEWYTNTNVITARWAADQVFLVCQSGKDTFEMACRVADGLFLARQTLGQFDLNARWNFYVDPSGGTVGDPTTHVLSFYQLGKPNTLTPYPAAGSITYPAYTDVRHTSGWIDIVAGDQQHHTLLKRQDPNYAFVRPFNRRIFFRGDRAYEAAGYLVSLLDLPSRKVVVNYRIPILAGCNLFTLEVAESDATVAVFSAVDRNLSVSPDMVRVDAFEKATGKQLGGMFLPRSFNFDALRQGWVMANPCAAGDGVMLITDRQGIYGLRYTAPGETPPTPTVAVTHAAVAQPPPAAAALSDIAAWGACDVSVPGSPVSTDARMGARVLAGHDNANLYLWLALPTARASRLTDEGITGSGMLVDLWVGSNHWLLGLAQPGRETAAGGNAQTGGTLDWRVNPRPAGAFEQVAFDGREMRWLLTLPLAEIAPGNRTIGISARIWPDEAVTTPAPGMGSSGPAGIAWGNVYLHPNTAAQQKALTDMAEAYTELPESWRVITEEARARTCLGGTDGAKYYTDFVRRHPRSPLALPALAGAHRLLRAAGSADPTDSLIAAATAAGVPADLVAAYRRAAHSYISQWVYSTTDVPNSSVRLDVLDSAAWHTVFWTGLGTGKAWEELRAGVIESGLYDMPIGGLHMLSSHNVLWGPTTLVTEAGTQVLVGDQPPAGAKLDGNWQWVAATPPPGGTRSHGDPRPAAPPGDLLRQMITLGAPMTVHFSGGSPYLSQWVYLDPAKPAKLVQIILSGGPTGIAYRWGPMEAYQKCLGPLPAPGTWTELRIPLAPELAGVPIRNITFMTQGGSAVFDRTAIVVDGKETVLIEDDLPGTPPPLTDGWEWVTAPVKSGAKAHRRTGGTEGAHYVLPTQPWDQHVPFKFPAVADALYRNAKAMPADSSWKYFQALDPMLVSVDDRVAHFGKLLQLMPDHPQFWDAVGAIKGISEQAGKPWLDKVEAVLQGPGVPRERLLELRRRYTYVVVANWQQLGPVPNPMARLEEKYPFARRVDVAADAAGLDGQRVKWRAVTGATASTPVEGPATGSFSVYAVTFLRCDKPRKLLVQVGTGSAGGRAWVNGAGVLAIKGNSGGGEAPVELVAGINELLVRLDVASPDNRIFCVVLRDPETALPVTLPSFIIPNPPDEKKANP